MICVHFRPSFARCSSAATYPSAVWLLPAETAATGVGAFSGLSAAGLDAAAAGVGTGLLGAELDAAGAAFLSELPSAEFEAAAAGVESDLSDLSEADLSEAELDASGAGV